MRIGQPGRLELDGIRHQRVGVATMSLEVTDGKGGGWDNVLFKVDSRGKIIPKSITSAGEEVVRFLDGVSRDQDLPSLAPRP